ncbi:MAG: hypothetical protein EOO07_33265 [Chitinophagaceae bacterium]|nr:MAG: hypothetical protein EOO07_33265 [Chitinophagaceae bacterium]
MKKVLFFAVLLASSLCSNAQNTDTLKISIQKKAEAIGHGGNNELKINLLFTVIGLPEISYERLLADNMGVGVSAFVGLDNSIEYKFGFVPYYRIYFGAKKASGFFIEGNASVITTTRYRYAYYNDFSPYPESQNLGDTFFGWSFLAYRSFERGKLTLWLLIIVRQ